MHFMSDKSFGLEIQWKPLIVITDNAIIQLMLSLHQRPDQLSQTSRKLSVYCDQIHEKIRLMLSVFHSINQNNLIFTKIVVKIHKKLKIILSFIQT